MKVIEQMRDDYGNLMQLWGIYDVPDKVLLEKDLSYPRKNKTKKLICTFDSLFCAGNYLNNEKS